MPDIQPHDTEKAIKAIQNVAIILTGATDFVCEARMLKRLSVDITENLEKLENDINSLKKKFPGKFPETLQPDSSLSKIRNFATALQKGSPHMDAKCQAGNFGSELSIMAADLKGIVKNIWDAMSGKVARYSLTDMIAEFGGKVKSTLASLSPLVSNTGRIILAALLVVIIAFVYLFVTMESEVDLLESIKKDRMYIKEQKELLEKQKIAYKEIVQKIKSLDKKNLTREEKIEFLNLSTQEKKVNEILEKAIFSIETREKNIKEKNKKVEEIRKKSFFQKLLSR